MNLDDLEKIARAATPLKGINFDGYAIDAQGNVYSLNHWRGTFFRKLSARPNSHGYLRVFFSYKNNRKSFFVHKLVAVTFLGPKPTKNHEVCHKNGNRKDNRVENIYWGTRKENAADREKHGNTARGARNGWSNLNPKKHSHLQPRNRA